MERFSQEFEAKYPKAVDTLTKDQDELLTFFDYPAEHWIHLRTTNPIESPFSTVKARTRKTKALSIFNFVFFVYNPPAITTPEGSKRCQKRQFTNVSVLRASSLENIQTRSYTIK
jgi:transposase-like protein